MDGEPYSDPVLDHFRRPRNAGVFPPGTPGLVRGEARESEGARLVRIELVLDGGARVAEARFKAFGCPATIACASFVTADVAGRSLEEAAALCAADVSRELSLPARRSDAAELAVRALRAALSNAPPPG